MYVNAAHAASAAPTDSVASADPAAPAAAVPSAAVANDWNFLNYH